MTNPYAATTEHTPNHPYGGGGDAPSTAYPTSDEVFAQAKNGPETGDTTSGDTEPEVLTGVVEPKPTDAQPTTADVEVRAKGDVATDVWAYERMEFKGDLLEVRCPTQQALAGFSLASSKYVPNQVKNDIVGLFVVKHLSDKSYGHVMFRLMDPDDHEYTPETIGHLMRDIANLGVEAGKTEDADAAK